MREQLENAGASWTSTSLTQGKTEEDIDAELTEAATEAVQVQLLLDTFADAEEISVSDDEFGHEIVHRAQRAGVAPQQYYDQLVRAGAAGVIFGDVRRGKALAALLERVVIEDTNGERLTLADLRGDDDEHDHEVTTTTDASPALRAKSRHVAGPEPSKRLLSAYPRNNAKGCHDRPAYSGDAGRSRC